MSWTFSRDILLANVTNNSTEISCVVILRGMSGCGDPRLSMEGRGWKEIMLPTGHIPTAVRR